MMKKFLKQSLVAVCLVVTCFPLQSLDYFKERYDRFMLGNELYQILQDKVAEDKCSVLKDRADRVVFAENVYSTPLWISWFNYVSPYESLFSYAFNLYTIAANVLQVVEKEMKQLLPQLSMMSLTVRGNMDFVLVGHIKEIDEEQIAANIQTVKDILKRYKKEVAGSAIPQKDKTRISNSIDAGLGRIEKAAQRLTRIERWHRNMKRERFDDYVMRYCKY
jgi:hypothetical protein